MFNFEYIKDILKRNILAISSIAFGVISLFLSIGIVLLNDRNCDNVCESDTLAYLEVESNQSSVDVETVVRVKVDVKGAVKKPGVYELEIGSIVDDAIKLAGGVTSKGVTTNINLSRRVSDEMVVYVFTKNELEKSESANEVVCEVPKCDCETITIEECPNSNSNNNNSSSTNATKKVSINKATLEELMTLNGVGESKAKAIIEYRNENGPFKTLEDIINVSGIGSSVYEKIKDSIEL